MSGRIEHASGDRNDFPDSWGTPPGSRLSEERAAWLREKVTRMQRDPKVLLRRIEHVELCRVVDPLVDLQCEARDKGLDRLADDLGMLIAERVEERNGRLDRP